MQNFTTGDPQEPDEAKDAGDGRVRLAGQLVPIAAVRHDPGRFTRLLGRARAEVGYAECLCQVPALKLVIRSRSGRFHLAGWPGGGRRHSPECLFHKSGDDLSGRALHTAEAISETVEGTAIRLAVPLQVSGGRTVDEAVTGPSREAGGGTRATSLLGLLHWLWEEAGLNLWHPRWHRSWSTCHTRLLQDATACTVNGQELADLLYVIPPYRPLNADANTAAFAAFCRQLTRARRHGGRGRDRQLYQQRGLILGEVKAAVPATYGTRFVLRHHRGALFAGAGLAGRVRRSYRAAFSAAAEGAAADAAARRIGLFLVERTAKNNLAIVDMAIMLTSRLWIPADSFYEVAMADLITAAGHSFTKPVRYDRAEAVFPDFVITGIGKPFFVEVYGVQGRADYDQRKSEKKAYYQAAGASVVEWDVTQAMPDLPPAGISRKIGRA